MSSVALFTVFCSSSCPPPTGLEANLWFKISELASNKASGVGFLTVTDFKPATLIVIGFLGASIKLGFPLLNSLKSIAS